MIKILLFAFALLTPPVIGFIVHLVAEHESKKEHLELRKEIWKDLLQKKVIFTDNYGKKYQFEIKNAARMTFERFINLYSISPENWYICQNKNDIAYYVPCYVKDNIVTDKRGKEKEELELCPLFWVDDEDMEQYTDWIENVYKAGEAALFEQKRNKNLEKLTQYIQEDLRKKREEAEKQMRALEADTKKHLEDLKKSEEKCLELSDGTKVKIPKE